MRNFCRGFCRTFNKRLLLLRSNPRRRKYSHLWTLSGTNFSSDLERTHVATCDIHFLLLLLLDTFLHVTETFQNKGYWKVFFPPQCSLLFNFCVPVNQLKYVNILDSHPFPNFLLVFVVFCLFIFCVFIEHLINNVTYWFWLICFPSDLIQICSKKFLLVC
ncbi:hypothetical protein AMECASPLE_034774 [Ameca splendens]|uniref:Uncharacterized protein n=1 Tax=Ameca splendens TaxID=208324 RepID=A0ABV0Y744_9TELE